jgi:hypothetical protein
LAASALGHTAGMLRITAVVVLVAALAACTRTDNRWTAADEGGAKTETAAQPATGTRIVLFAPTSVGPLETVYPEARLDFPHDMAQRVDLLVREADGRVGEHLPDSAANEWSKGRVAATAGAHVVVLTTIQDLKTERGAPDVHGAADRVIATIELQALDVNGMTIFARKASGEADVPMSPKLQSPSSRPESRAAWRALSSALAALRTYLDEQRSLVNAPRRGSQDAPVGTMMVEFVIDSRPSNADVLIDGQYRGTTPQRVRLPNKPITIRIERQGFQPWERQLTPNADLRIEPVLEAKTDDAKPAGK